MTEPHDWQSRLREARRELGLSQHALARLTRLSAETIRATKHGAAARRRRISSRWSMCSACRRVK